MTSEEALLKQALLVAISQRDELLAALEYALEQGCRNVYTDDQDDVGLLGCCQEVSYRPHAPDCWTIKARAAIAKAIAQPAQPTPATPDTGER